MQSIVVSNCRYSLAIVVLPLLLGCGGSTSLETTPIEGVVTFDGEPVAMGEVRYMPVDAKKGRVARGALRPDGTFQLTTLKSGDGALPGEYRVVVVVYEEQFEDQATQHQRRVSENNLASRAKVAVPPSAGPPIPERYYRPETSGLTDLVDQTHPRHREFTLTK